MWSLSLPLLSPFRTAALLILPSPILSGHNGQFLGAFRNKFLQFADVRFYTLQSVRKVANSLSSNEKTAHDDEEDIDDGGGEFASSSLREELSASDVARNCLDLLLAVPER